MCCYDAHGGYSKDPGAVSTLVVEPDKYCRCLGFGKGVHPVPYTDVMDGACCTAIDGEDGLCGRCRKYCQSNPGKNLTDKAEGSNLLHHIVSDIDPTSMIPEPQAV